MCVLLSFYFCITHEFDNFTWKYFHTPSQYSFTNSKHHRYHPSHTWKAFRKQKNCSKINLWKASCYLLDLSNILKMWACLRWDDNVETSLVLQTLILTYHIDPKQRTIFCSFTTAQHSWTDRNTVIFFILIEFYDLLD